MEIRSFRHKSLDRLWRRGDVRGIPAAWVEKVRAMLTAIEEAGSIDDIARFLGCKLHQLKGDRKQTWATSVTGNMRLTFAVRSGGIEDVDLEDYH